MANVIIRTETKIDEGDYSKILAFADKDERNAPLKDLGKLIEQMIEVNVQNIIGQASRIETKATLYGVNGEPLAGPGPG